MRRFLTLAALVVGILGAGVSPAFAAKGVKKNPAAANGVHTIHGVVTHVHHHKSKNAQGHIGEVTIKTHHHKKKGQPAAGNGKPVAGNGKPAGNNGKKVSSGQTHTFTVGSSTGVSMVQGKQHRPASFQALHTGEHVSITHKGKHAESVAIHMHTNSKSKTARPTSAKPKKKPVNN